MKKKNSFLHIEKIGLLEILFALFPIVAGYQYGSIPMSLVWLFIMDVIACAKKRKPIREKTLVWFAVFVLLHEFIVWVITGYPQTHFNYILLVSMCLASIFIITPALQYDRLEGSLYLIGIIACIGIIYHFVMILSGELISPIRLPFLPAPSVGSRLYEVMDRPCSFFWEPASFVTYMMIPFFISLIKKRWVLLVFILICVFLSTSTNGIILAPIMVFVYIFMARQKAYSRVLVAALLVGMVFLLFNSEYFVSGTDKLTNTQVNSNVRISNGPWLITHMPSEYIIFGLPTHTVEEFISLGFVSNERVRSDGTLFLSDFWLILVTYGIVGLLLHLSVYFSFVRREKTLWPYVAILLVAQFSQSVSLRPLYVYQICFVICFLNNQHLITSKDESNV